jgi:hypothetical protein
MTNENGNSALMDSNQAEMDGARLFNPRYKTVRVERKPFFADILCDRLEPNLFTYVVQKEGSTEILGWGQVRSLKDARHEAELAFRQLATHHGRAEGDSRSQFQSPECTS